VISEPFLSNGHLLLLHHSGFQPSCHNALSLRIFVPSSLTVYHRSFFSEYSVRDVNLWLGLSRGDHSPTATKAPTLRELFPIDSLISQSRCITIIQSIYLPKMRAKLSQVAGARTFQSHLTLTVLVGSFPFRRGPTPPQYPILDVSQRSSGFG
jgi:hypothetical protein